MQLPQKEQLHRPHSALRVQHQYFRQPADHRQQRRYFWQQHQRHYLGLLIGSGCLITDTDAHPIN